MKNLEPSRRKIESVGKTPIRIRGSWSVVSFKTQKKKVVGSAVKRRFGAGVGVLALKNKKQCVCKTSNRGRGRVGGIGRGDRVREEEDASGHESRI